MKRQSLAVWVAGMRSSGVADAAGIFLSVCRRSGVRIDGARVSEGSLVLYRIAAETGTGNELPSVVPDVAVALEEDSIHPESAGTEVLIFDGPESVTVFGGVKTLGLPFAKLAPDRGLRGAVAAGAMTLVAGLDSALGPSDDEPAGRAFRAGYDYAAANFPDLGLALETSGPGLVLVDGRDAAAAGLAAAGCRFFASVAGRAGLGPRFKRLGSAVVREAPDPAGAANMALGAAFAGLRAGAEFPEGEALLAFRAAAWAQGAEVPAVFFSEDASASESFPGVVLAPASVPDACEVVQQAFDAAERFQVPALILIERSLLDHFSTMTPAPAPRAPERGVWAVPAPDSPSRIFDRYAATPAGVSPRAVPGQPGLLHSAIPPELLSGRGRAERAGLLRRKAAGIGRCLPSPAIEGEPGARVVFAASGAAAVALRPALARLNAEAGTGTGALCPLRLRKPFPAKDLAATVSRAGRVVAVAADPSDPILRWIDEAIEGGAGRPLAPMQPGTAGRPPRQAGHPSAPMQPGTAGRPPRQTGTLILEEVWDPAKVLSAVKEAAA